MPEGNGQYCKSECNENKRIKIEESSKVVQNNYRTSLMSLSDDVLLIIFAHLGPPDLLSLSQCCHRFEEVTKDRTLWECVDFRPEVHSLINLKKFIRFFQAGTKSIACCGPAYSKKQTPYPSMSKSFLRGVAKNAPNLTTLVLENHVIDTSKLLLEDFPSSLQNLKLQKCIMNNIATDKSYFFNFDKTFPKLKVLDLSDSEWFAPHSLLALSKSHTLEELNLSGCDVSDCLPYASLASNFGFCSLKVLDLRNTFVSDIEVSCFNRISTLRHLLLKAPETGEVPPPEVTDYSITTFGGRPRDENNDLNVREGVIIIEVGSYPRPACKLETLVLRGYPGITDVTLKHTAAYMKNLTLIDVTDSGCSETGLQHFKLNRPDVKVFP